MTYTLSFGVWGSECVAATIPDEIWKYIQDECDGDASTYLEKLDEGEVPDELKIAEDNSEFCDAGSQFFHEYGAYSDGSVTVCCEDQDDVEIPLSDLPKETEYLSATNGKPYFVWESVEKGSWDVTIETDEPFDKSKLKVLTKKLCYNHDDDAKELVTGIEYDGDFYDVEVNSTRGISFELDFYEAEDDSEEE